MTLRIHWYPGHMSKAKRIIKENIKLMDLVIELRDARIPRSSTNPEFESLCRGKERLVLLNKRDLADPSKTQEWMDFFKRQGVWGQAINCLSSAEMNELKKSIIRFAEEKRRIIKQQKGIYKTIRAMVVGIPNVGKSTFINRLAGSSKARVEDRPGVTRGKQWIKIHPYVEFLDTPGLLWPKAEDQTAMLNLAYIGSINDDILDLAELSYSFLDMVKNLYPQVLEKRYNLERIEDMNGNEILEAICLNQKWVRSGGMPDIERGARHLLNDYCLGRLGQMTLESP